MVLCVSNTYLNAQSATTSQPIEISIDIDDSYIGLYQANQPFKIKIKLLQPDYFLTYLNFKLQFGSPTNKYNEFRWSDKTLKAALENTAIVDQFGTPHFFDNITVIPFSANNSPSSNGLILDHIFTVSLRICHHKNGNIIPHLDTSALRINGYGPTTGGGTGLITIDIDGNEIEADLNGHGTSGKYVCGNLNSTIFSVVANNTFSINSSSAVGQGSPCGNRLSSEVKRLDIIPNPATRHITISGIEEIVDIALFSTDGSSSNIKLDPKRGTIDVSDLPRGTYILRAVLENGTVENHKVILTD